MPAVRNPRATARRSNDRSARALRGKTFARVITTTENGGRVGAIVALKGWRVLLAFNDGGRSPLTFAVGAVEGL